MVPSHQNAKPRIFPPVNDGVGKVGQRMNLPPIRSGCSKTGMLLQQLCHSFELCEKSPSKAGSRFGLVEPNCLCEIFRCEPVDGSVYLTSARSRASTSSSSRRTEGS